MATHPDLENLVAVLRQADSDRLIVSLIATRILLFAIRNYRFILALITIVVSSRWMRMSFGSANDIIRGILASNGTSLIH